MNSIFHKESDEFVVVYIDNILVFSKRKVHHKKHLWIVLSKLQENQLYINKEKNIFDLEELEFFRHIINNKRIKWDSKKIQVIKTWEIFKTQKGIRSFLGLTNYYQKFIKNFSKIVGPLMSLLKKDNKSIK